MDATGSRRDAVRILATTWVLLVLAVLALGWLLTHPWEPVVDPREDSLVRWLADHRTPGLDTAAAVGSKIADTRVGGVLACVLAVALSWWQRSWRPLAYYGTLVAGAYTLYVVVTRLITRDRPPVEILDPGLVPDDSFPSGHVATSIVVYAATAILLATARPEWRRWTWPLLLVPVVVIASRLHQGAHHPTDVLTSVAFASIWVAVVARVVLRGGSGPPAST